MSVILRRGDSVVLYCKGADNVIYDRLHGGQEDLKARTQDHLNVSFPIIRLFVFYFLYFFSEIRG